MKSSLSTVICLSVMLFGLAGCSGQAIQEFANKEPSLDLFSYFKGNTQAWGLFEDRFGKVRRQFTVKIEGTVDGDMLTLDEHFVYDDGEIDQRIWKIRALGNKTYEGHADDVVGVAHGVAAGNALNWRYDFNLMISGSAYRVHFNDWMFLQEDGVMINRARVSKWGISIGEVTLFFSKPSKTNG